MNFHFSFVFLFASSFCVAQSHFVAFGGGGSPPDGVEKVSELAGGELARYLHVSWMSDAPGESAAYFHELFDPHHPSQMDEAPAFVDVKPHLSLFLSSLGGYTGIIFSGGDQNILMDICDENPTVADALRKAYQDGVVFSGSSAGLAVMSATMIAGDGDMTKLGPLAASVRAGLGFLSLAIVDQHFITRNRMQRLMSAVMGGTERYGIGVDEGTGIHVTDGKDVEVLGKSQVVLIDKGATPGKLTMEIFQRGDRFTLR